MTNKEAILNATLDLAVQSGLGCVSMSQIAKKVGIQKQSLYNHVSSKEELLNEMYEYLRQKAKSHVNEVPVDYGEFVKGKQPEDILMQAVLNYTTMNQDSDMEKFYKFILSERSIHKEAAKIMVSETEKMILSTKQLFYAMQVQHVMDFQNVDMAAFTFAMTIHSIIDYLGDQKMSGEQAIKESLISDYITDFCRVYGK